MLVHIVAMSLNRVIGKDNKIPWRQKHDLARFKALTTGHTVIMGRKTYDSILQRLGKPLPNRTSIVLTRKARQSDRDGVRYMTEAGLQQLAENTARTFTYVLGGSEIYTLTLPYTTRILLTQIEAHVDGDVVYPPLDSSWTLKSKETYRSDTDNQYPYSFCEFVRT